VIRILIADDHALVRGGMVQLFALAGDIEVVAQATNGGEVIEQLRQVVCDVIVLDMCMPGISGVELIARVHAKLPTLPILILSMHNDARVARRALYAGAAGYMSKDGDPETLLLAIRKIAAGGRYIDQGLAEQLAFQPPSDSRAYPHEQLSNRELCVFKLLVAGKTVNEVAAELAISNKTVSTHKARLMEKMGFRSNADMIRYGIDHALDA